MFFYSGLNIENHLKNWMSDESLNVLQPWESCVLESAGMTLNAITTTTQMSSQQNDYGESLEETE